MRGLAPVVMVLGLVLMSVPFVLPRLGIDLSATATSALAVKTPSGPVVGGQGGGGFASISGIGNALTAGFGSVAAILGEGGPATGTGMVAAASTQDALNAQFGEVCAALAAQTGMDPVECAEGLPSLTGAASFGASAAAPPVPEVSIRRHDGALPRGGSGGAKFVKVEP